MSNDRFGDAKQAEEYNENLEKKKLESARNNLPDNWGKKPVGTKLSEGVYFDEGFIVVGDKL